MSQFFSANGQFIFIYCYCYWAMSFVFGSFRCLLFFFGLVRWVSGMAVSTMHFHMWWWWWCVCNAYHGSSNCTTHDARWMWMEERRFFFVCARSRMSIINYWYNIKWSFSFFFFFFSLLLSTWMRLLSHEPINNFHWLLLVLCVCCNVLTSRWSKPMFPMNSHSHWPLALAEVTHNNLLRWLAFST